MSAAVEAELPDGYRWATEEECDQICRGERKDALLVHLTKDSSGKPYTEGEADLAVPIDIEEVPELLTYKDALDLAIFAINTLMYPDASSRHDVDTLERMSEAVVLTLADIRETVIGMDAA